MKVIVDIKNKTLKMLENERSIFKGEYSADKLELYINQQLENEYPVITGLLSNGRRIGAFTTDDGYEVETIDGVEYTKAKFTLSKENGFPLSAGATQVTIWMYRTKDSVLVSKEAIGNVVFTVVDTTTFNDGDIIISGDVEGTVVNLKVELENLQSRLEQYLPLSGAKAMTGDLSMKGNNIIFDNDNEETIEIGEEDNEYSMSIRMEDNDYYKGRYRASGFSVGNEVVNANLDISESKFEMSLKDGGQTSMTPDGFSVSKNGNTTFYEQNNITYYIDNFSKEIKNIFPNESGTIALKEKSLQKKGDKMADNLDMDGYNIQKAFNVQVSNSLDVGKSISIGDFKFRNMVNSDNALQVAIPQDKSLNFLEYYNNGWGNGVRIDTSKKALIPINAILTSKYTLGTSDDQWVSIWGKTIYQNGKQVATKEEIPTKTSQLTNNSGFITKAVNNLTNYYLKSDTYTKDEVQQLLSSISSLKLEVVTNLPTTNISSNTIYLKPLDSTKENNIYEEYIYINSKWETIGTTAVDLTNYALKEDIPTKISELEQDVELGVSEEDVLQIIEDNSSNTSQMDVDTSISIGTSADYNPNSDTQIPTTKAVQEMINVGGGSGSGSGNYLPLSGGTMTGSINMDGYSITCFNRITSDEDNDENLIASAYIGDELLLSSYTSSIGVSCPGMLNGSIRHLIEYPNTGQGGDDSLDEYVWKFPSQSGEVVVKDESGDVVLTAPNGTGNSIILGTYDTGVGMFPYVNLHNEDSNETHYGVGTIYHYNYREGKECFYDLPSKSGTIALTEDIVTESRVNELIAAYMTANYDNGDEGSY